MMGITVSMLESTYGTVVNERVWDEMKGFVKPAQDQYNSHSDLA